MPNPPSDALGGDTAAPDDAVAGPAFVDDGRSIYRLEYHLFLATRRRRPFFADEAFRRRSRELIEEVCADAGCHVEGLTIHPSTVQLHVFAPPYLAPHLLVAKLRSMAGRLWAEFPAVGSNGGLFVRRYIASSAPTPETARKRFVNSLPTR